MKMVKKRSRIAKQPTRGHRQSSLLLIISLLEKLFADSLSPSKVQMLCFGSVANVRALQCNLKIERKSDLGREIDSKTLSSFSLLTFKINRRVSGVASSSCPSPELGPPPSPPPFTAL